MIRFSCHLNGLQFFAISNEYILLGKKSNINSNECELEFRFVMRQKHDNNSHIFPVGVGDRFSFLREKKCRYTSCITLHFFSQRIWNFITLFANLLWIFQCSRRRYTRWLITFFFFSFCCCWTIWFYRVAHP